jgi:hypothetical protein
MAGALVATENLKIAVGKLIMSKNNFIILIIFLAKYL